MFRAVSCDFVDGVVVRGDGAGARAFLTDWTLSGIMTLQSGFAYSALIADDANRDGNSATDRVPGIERNQFTSPAIYVFDPRGIANSAATVLTKPNITTPFGAAGNFLGERQMQLAVRLKF